MWLERYREDIEAAGARVRAVPTEIIRTPWGRVQYATCGGGQPVLMSHGILGGHAEGLGMVRTYYGEDAFAIAPSRFGYFDSTLPEDATPALQADVYAALLDHLDVERAVAIGFSAGGPSIVEFGLRHPDRVELLVLASSALPTDPLPRLAVRVGPPLMKAGLSTELVFWSFKTLFPGAFRRLIGIPKSFVPSSEEQAVIREVGESVMPVEPRRDGAVFDTFFGNPWVNRSPLEDITVPTMIIHAADDALAPYRTATAAAARMSQARFITIESGGHEFLGHENDVRHAIHTCLNELRSPLTRGSATIE